MLKSLKKLVKRSPISSNFDIKNIDESNLPVMTGDELIRVLNQTNRIRSIKRKVMIDNLRFEKMYLEPIHRFCEIVQLTPASQAHHHSFPGGLIIHTLSVAELAINERMKYTLPLSSEPHIIEAQKSLWTFAVFVSALCHDIGKTVTMVSFIDNATQEPKNILGGTMLEQNVKSYHFNWKPTEYYKLHQQIGTSFLTKLLDDLCLSYLSDELDIFREVIAYIQNDEYNWGSIGHILQIADSTSTAESLKIATGSRKFRGANLENFGERIMRTLRLILNNSSIPKNRAGAAIWVDDYYTYAVAKPFAEMIREEMKKHGATDIPSDNTRIFDELQHQNFCETNTDGQAIFKVEVSLNDTNFKQSFTCIKLRNKNLFTANKLPKPIAGNIIELTGVAAQTQSHTEPVVTETKTPEPVKSQTPVKQNNSFDETVPTEKPTVEPVKDDLFDEVLGQTLSGSSPEPVLAYKQPAETVNNEINSSESTIENQTTESVMDEKGIVKDFFEWLLQKVDSKEYVINRDSPLYVVEYNDKKHLAIIDKGYVSSISERSEMLEAAKKIQKPFHQQKINIGIAGKQVHFYKKNNSPSAKSPKLSFYLVPLDKISNQELKTIITEMEYSENIKRMFTEVKN